MVRKLVQAEIDENPTKKVIPDAELQAYYQAHLDDFVRPEMVRLSAILLATPDAASQAKRASEAKHLLDDLKAKAADFSAFGAQARAKSEDLATKSVDGDLRFNSKDQLTQHYGPELAEAGFKLTKIGELSEVIKTPKGLYLLKLTGRTPALNQTFDQVKNQVQSRLWYEKRSKLYDGFVDDLKKKGNYSVVDGELDKVVVQTNAPTVMNGMAMPPGLAPQPGMPQPGMGQPGMGQPGMPLMPGQHAAQALPHTLVPPVPAKQAVPVQPAGH
jgi:parvulin-like peptidyl-prolyl isomerase